MSCNEKVVQFMLRLRGWLGDVARAEKHCGLIYPSAFILPPSAFPYVSQYSAKEVSVSQILIFFSVAPPAGIDGFNSSKK